MGKLSKVLGLVSKYVAAISDRSAVICLAIMTLIITADVIGRALGIPTLIADEISRYMLIGIAFLGLARTQKTGGHIDLDTVTRLLPIQVQKILSVIALFINFAFVVWLFIVSVPNFINNLHATSLSYLDVPMWIVHLGILFGIGFLIIQMLTELITLLFFGRAPASNVDVPVL